jgi:hypothetical protein
LLPDYPKVTPGQAFTPTDQTNFKVATAARQQFARDIFDLLRAVTGASDDTYLNSIPPANLVTSVEFRAVRWLAQLAVNLVDYIDRDDYITPFNWFTQQAGNTKHWVYGTEMPRVLLNEAYVQYESDAVTHQLIGGVKVWVELYNPLRNDDPNNPMDTTGTVHLDWVNNVPPPGTDSIYRLMICRPDPNPPDPKNPFNHYLRKPENTRGTPRIDDPTHPDPLLMNTDNVYPQFGGGAAAIVTRFSPPTNPPPMFDQTIIKPAAPYGSLSAGAPNAAGPFNTGYYMIGPSSSPNNVNKKASSEALAMQYQPDHTAKGDFQNEKPTIVLQRLACPALAVNWDPNDPLYNPYVTTDYMLNVFNDNDVRTLGNQAGQSEARKQPYAAEPGQRPPTFYAKNTADFTMNPPGDGQPADWLIHLDRPPRNQMELLNVSGYKPHELTQQFMSKDAMGNPKTFGHRAPWYDEGATPNSSRLYRALEFLSTRSPALGLAAPLPLPAGSQYPQPWVNYTTLAADIKQPNTVPSTITITLDAIRGVNPSGVPWNIQDNMVVILDPGVAPDPNNSDNPSQENVKVNPGSISGNSFQATVYKRHDKGAAVLVTSLGDRIPGKFNINTVWNPEIVDAFCDAQPSNAFPAGSILNPGTPEDTTTLFGKLVALRTPNLLNKANPGGPALQETDSPFRSLTTGLSPAPPNPDPQYPMGVSLDNTVVRGVPANPMPGPGTPYYAGQRWFAPPVDAMKQDPNAVNPFFKEEVLAKVANHLTTRSNVFAVWVTVGFFEVTSPPGVNPPQLGAEIGRAENRHVRHRMFAVVDRTNLLLQQTAQFKDVAGNPVPSPVGGLAPAIASSPLPVSLRQAVNPDANPQTVELNGTTSGTTVVTTVPYQRPVPPLTWHMDWKIEVRTRIINPPNATPVRGTVLLFDAGTPNEEAVVVTNVLAGGGPGRFKIEGIFNKPHSTNTPVSALFQPGNPGPRARFDYRTNTALVPYVSIIK